MGIIVHNVLLVEDSSDAFNLVKRALGSSIHLEWAKSLGEASKILQKKAFDLILLDVMLPDGDGYRLCSILQTDDQSTRKSEGRFRESAGWFPSWLREHYPSYTAE